MSYLEWILSTCCCFCSCFLSFSVSPVIVKTMAWNWCFAFIVMVMLPSSLSWAEVAFDIISLRYNMVGCYSGCCITVASPGNPSEFAWVDIILSYTKKDRFNKVDKTYPFLFNSVMSTYYRIGEYRIRISFEYLRIVGNLS